MHKVSGTPDIGSPKSQARLRVAAEWLSFSSLVVGLVLSSSSEVVWRWLGLFTLAAGALIAWFSHLSMRSELERAQLDAEACTACGHCVGVCPTQALSVRRRPGHG